jgi:hypothetical protein
MESVVKLSELIDESTTRAYAEALWMQHFPVRDLERHLKGLLDQLQLAHASWCENWKQDQDKALSGEWGIGLGLRPEARERAANIIASARQTTVGKLLHETGGEHCAKLKWWVNEYSRAQGQQALPGSYGIEKLP